MKTCFKCGAEITIDPNDGSIWFSCNCYFPRKNGQQVTFNVASVYGINEPPMPIDTSIVDDEPDCMYNYFYELCIQHAATCKICDSLREVDLPCLELRELRELRTKWLALRITQMQKRG